jgi:hypothetical protein
MEVGTRRQFEWLKLVLIVTFIINAIDGVFTVMWVLSGAAHEANPIMDHLLDSSPMAFMSVKLLLVALGTWLLWRFRRQRIAVIAIFFLFLVYYSILVYHFRAFAEHFFPDLAPIEQPLEDSPESKLPGQSQPAASR